jgi:hypothetical protein
MEENLKAGEKEGLNVFSKTKILLEQLEQIAQAEKAGSQIIQAIKENYFASNIYRGILERSHLLEQGGKVVPFVLATNSCPEAFCLCPQEKGVKQFNLLYYSPINVFNPGILNYKEKGRTVDFYNLIITPTGKTELFLFRKEEGQEEDEEPAMAEEYAFFLNLPLLLLQIIKTGRHSEVNKRLKGFIKANASSTLANLYNYVTAEPETVAEILIYVSTFAKITEELYDISLNLADASNRSKNSLKTFKPNFDTRHAEKYTFKKEKNGALVAESAAFIQRLNDVNHKSSEKYAFNFPAKILLEKTKAVPYFFPAEISEKEKLAFEKGEETSFLISLEAKVISLLETYKGSSTELRKFATRMKDNRKNSGNSVFGKVACLNPLFDRFEEMAKGKDIEETEKIYKQELENNAAIVLKELTKSLKSTKVEEISKEATARLARLKELETSLQTTVTAMVKLLVQMYKKEVILNEL